MNKPINLGIVAGLICVILLRFIAYFRQAPYTLVDWLSAVFIGLIIGLSVWASFRNMEIEASWKKNKRGEAN